MTDPRKPARAYEEAQPNPEPEAPEEALFEGRTDVGAPEIPATVEAPPEAEPLVEPEEAIAVETPAEPEPDPAPAAEPVVDTEPVLTAAQSEPLFTPDPVVEAEPEHEPGPEPDADADAHFDHGPEPWEHVPPPAPKAPSRRVAPVAVAAAPVATPEPVPTEARGRDYGAGAPPEAFATGEASPETKKTPFAVYLLYLTSFVLVGAPAALGVWIAYKARADAPEWLTSHYVFQIRTFWIAVGGIVAGLVLIMLPFGLGPLALMAVVVWVTLRCFVGMVRLHRGEPIYNPQTWTV